jgi:hypothetical protein
MPMSEFHKIVHKHYPLAVISGDGRYALISTCAAVPKVSLFELASAASSTAELWSAYGCADGVQCSGAHLQKRIRLQESPPPVTEPAPPYCWEQDRE